MSLKCNKHGRHPQCHKEQNVLLCNAGLRGMAATSSIEPGEVLVSIPVEAALVVSPKERCQLPSGFCDAAFYQRKPWCGTQAMLG
jgi:hypothetical protein